MRALDPTVAIFLNGPAKGGEPETFARLRGGPGLKDIFAMHRNLATPAADNAQPELTLSASDEASCQGGWIRLSVQPGGKAYTVAIPAKGVERAYAVRS